MIDAVHVDVPITSLSLSPNTDVLATTHVDQNGVYLWFNQMMFSGASNIDSVASGKEVVGVKVPSVSPIQSSQAEDSDDIIKEVKTTEISWLPYSNQQIPDLVTLSLLPKSQWQGLVNLDVIKERKKPIEPPKKLEKAPFFVPSLPSVSGEILFKPNELASEMKDPKADDAKNSERKRNFLSSQFLQLLHSSADAKNSFNEYIKGLSPATLDMEFRMLQIVDDDAADQEDLEKREEFTSIDMLHDYFIHELSCRNNFEFLQAVIRLFLKIHGETIRCHPKLRDKAGRLLEAQSAVWQGMDKLFQNARCMVTFLSNSS